MSTLEKNSKIRLKHFRADGCISYLLSDPQSRAALIIDPVLEMMGDYRAAIAESGLKLVAVLETHLHTDHISASHMLRQQYQADIAMHEATQSRRPTRRLKKGD